MEQRDSGCSLGYEVPTLDEKPSNLKKIGLVATEMEPWLALERQAQQLGESYTEENITQIVQLYMEFFKRYWNSQIRYLTLDMADCNGIQFEQLDQFRETDEWKNFERTFPTIGISPLTEADLQKLVQECLDEADGSVQNLLYEFISAIRKQFTPFMEFLFSREFCLQMKLFDVESVFPFSVPVNCRYHLELIKVLGEGQFATVYEARHRFKPDETFALKVVEINLNLEAGLTSVVPDGNKIFQTHISLPKSPYLMKYCFPFAQCLWDINNKSPAKIHAFWMIRSTLWGIPLNKWIIENKSSLDNTAQKIFEMKMSRIMREWCSGILDLHSAGVTHGDMHLGNVLIQEGDPNDPYPWVKIIDFDLHKLTSICISSRNNDGDNDPNLTKSKKIGKQEDIRRFFSRLVGSLQNNEAARKYQFILNKIKLDEIQNIDSLLPELRLVEGIAVNVDDPDMAPRSTQAVGFSFRFLNPFDPM